MERPGAPLDLQHSIQISPQEPWVKLTANSKLVDFLVDTGEANSMLKPSVQSLKRPRCWERLKAGGEGTTEDEMVGWHHRLNGHEFELNSGSW